MSRIAAPATNDTVDAQPTGAYVLAVTNDDGSPVVGTTVTFRGTNAAVAAPGASFLPTATRETDSRGEVAVLIRFGQTAGMALVEASVPTIQRADTMRLTVRAGNPVRPSIMVSDTTFATGKAITVAGFPADRHGNAVGEPLPVTVESGTLRRTERGWTADGIGRSTLTATHQGSTARLVVTAVPQGEIVFTSGGRAWRSSLDGSDRTLLDFAVPSARERSIDWDSSGDRVVLGGRGGFTIFDLKTGQTVLGAWPGGSQEMDVIWPRFGPEGLVHFSASDGRGAWDIRKMSPEGSQQMVTIPSERFPNNDFFPDWDRTGRRFVFTADWEQRNRFLLRVADPGILTVTTIYVEGVTPVWSPDGGLIAYQEMGKVGVVSPDGTVQRDWDLGWSKGVSWAPDSETLVGLNGGRVALLDLATGDELILSDLGTGIDAVAWRPAVP